MKKLAVWILIVSPLALAAQVTSADSSAIRQAAYNYVGGFYNSDPNLVAKGVHPELVKRIVVSWKGDSRISNMGASDLMVAAKNSKKQPDPNPQEPFKLDVVIYDISQDIACVKIINNKMKFFDYCQLAKFNGEWKIINVLWATTQ